MGSTVESDIKDAKKSLNQLSEVDGSSEIIAGIVTLFISLDFAFNYPTSELIYLLVLGLLLGLNEFKKKYTYPRIGYYKEKHQSKIVNTEILGIKFIIILISLTVLSLLGSGANAEIAFPALFGIAIFGASIYLVAKIGEKKYYILGLGALISGILYSSLEFSSTRKQFGTFLLIWGIVFLTIGIIKFKSFTANYPKYYQA